MKICHLKIGKNRKRYPNKEISKTVMNILMKEDIYGAYYVYYPPRMTATPHVDYNPYGKKYLRIKFQLKYQITTIIMNVILNGLSVDREFIGKKERV